MKEVEAVFQEPSEGQDENIIDMSDAGDVDAIAESIEQDVEGDEDHLDEVHDFKTPFCTLAKSGNSAALPAKCFGCGL